MFEEKLDYINDGCVDVEVWFEEQVALNDVDESVLRLGWLQLPEQGNGNGNNNTDENQDDIQLNYYTKLIEFYASEVCTCVECDDSCCYTLTTLTYFFFFFF